MTCTAWSPSREYVVRSTSWRTTIMSSAAWSAARSSSPVSRKMAGLLYALLVGSICWRYQRRCCAKDRGSG
nr:hypothetical protein [Corallococcus sp. CA049B]